MEVMTRNGTARSTPVNGRSEYGTGAIRGVIFDLDGVLVDTAKYHYLAWKRLAGELHIDFTSADNERLKGVSRARSLEIILELGRTTLSEADKAKAAEKKNGWYLEYIQGVTPN